MTQNRKSISAIKRKLSTAFKNITGTDENSDFELFTSKNINENFFSNANDEKEVIVNDSSLNLNFKGSKNIDSAELLFDEKPDFKINKIHVNDLKIDECFSNVKTDKDFFLNDFENENNYIKDKWSKNTVENNNRYTNNSFKFNPANTFVSPQSFPAFDFNQHYSLGNYAPVSSNYFLNNFFQNFINQLFPAMFQQYTNNLISNAINQTLLNQNYQRVNSGLTTNEIVSNIESCSSPSVSVSYKKNEENFGQDNNFLSINDKIALRDEIKNLIVDGFKNVSFYENQIKNKTNDLKNCQIIDKQVSLNGKEKFSKEKQQNYSDEKKFASFFEKEKTYIDDAINYLKQKTSLINELYDKIEDQQDKIVFLENKINAELANNKVASETEVHKYQKKEESENLSRNHGNEKIFETEEIELPKESFWKKYIGDYRYGMYDKNDNWQWKGFFDENNVWHYYEYNSPYEFNNQRNYEEDTSEHFSDENEGNIYTDSPQFYKLVGDYESLDNLDSLTTTEYIENEIDNYDDYTNDSDIELEFKDSEIN